MWESSRLFRSALSTTSSPGTFFADTPRPAAPAGVQRLQGKPSLKMAHVCTRSNAFFSRNPLPRPAVSRSAAYRNRANLVQASAQNGELFFVTNNIFKVRSLEINICSRTTDEPHNLISVAYNRSNRRAVSSSRKLGRTGSHA